MSVQTSNIAMATMVSYNEHWLRIISSIGFVCVNFVGSFSDFGEFVARDNYFNSSSNTTMNNSANNFPIGTFSIEQATQPAANQTFPQTDYFNPATASQLMSKFAFAFAIHFLKLLFIIIIFTRQWH